MKDYDSYKTEPVDREYNTDNGFVNKYKKEIIITGTTTALLASSYAAWNVDKINDFLSGF